MFYQDKTFNKTSNTN